MTVWHVKSLLQEGSSLLDCQAFLLWSHCSYGPTRRDYQDGAQSPWTNATWSNHPMWDGVGFTLSLSGCEETPEEVCLALVEKVRVLSRRIVPVMHVKGEKPFIPDLKSLESDVWEPSMSCQVGLRMAWPLWRPASMAIARHP
jgi:hypothetical protein